MPITDTKTKQDAIKRALADLADTRIIVGVIGAKAAYPVTKNANLADIASFNEFGTSSGSYSGRGIPSRSFLRSTFDEQQESYSKIIGQLVKRAMAGTMTRDQIANRLGMTIKADVDRKIVTLSTPPNTETTIKLKGSSNPLIAKGQLRQSIEYDIRRKSEVKK